MNANGREYPWPMVKLGELVTQVSRSEKVEAGREYRLLGVRLDGNGAFLRETRDGAEMSASRVSRVSAGDFIYSRLFAWRGAFDVIDQNLDGCFVSNEFPTFICDDTRVDAHFLNYYFRLKPTLTKVEADCTGSTPQTRNRFKERFFLNLEIPLPPLPEQKRIVAKVQSLASKIDEARELREQAAIEARAIQSAGRKSVFERAAEHYPSRPLETLSSRITKGESPAWQGFGYQETGPLFVRSENVLWGTLDVGNAKRIPADFHEKLSRSQLAAGDVLINLVGASIGRACAVPLGLGQANVNQAVAVITPVPEGLHTEFLVHFLLSPIAQDAIHGAEVETARPNISLRDIRRLGIPTPPLNEQRKLVAELEALQSQSETLTAAHAETGLMLNALTPAILDRAFKGQL